MNVEIPESSIGAEQPGPGHGRHLRSHDPNVAPFEALAKSVSSPAQAPRYPVTDGRGFPFRLYAGLQKLL